MTQTTSEAIARIIDPDAWTYFDTDAGQHNGTDLLRFDAWKQSSLRKARAIVALPDLTRDDLLAALKAILHTYDDGGVPLRRAFKMANAAIAKAERHS